jgi:Cys-tRNA(Pro) deacylase
MPDTTITHGAPTAALLAYLERYDCPATLHQPGVPMPTVPLAAGAIGVSPDQILKSLLFVSDTGAVVLAIASGTGKINRARLAAVSGAAKLKMADAATVQRVTGYPVGGVAPVGHAEPVPVVIDERVMALPVAFGGGGAEDVLLEIDPSAIQRLTGATVADIADPAPDVAPAGPDGP